MSELSTCYRTKTAKAMVRCFVTRNLGLDIDGAVLPVLLLHYQAVGSNQSKQLTWYYYFLHCYDG